MLYNTTKLNNDIQKLTEQLAELELEASIEGFWDNVEYAAARTKLLNATKVKLYKLKDLRQSNDDIQIMELWLNRGELLQADFDVMQEELDWKWNNYLTESLLDGPYDTEDAIITLHAGSGGTEAEDFNDMILRALVRWCERKEWKVTITDIENGGVAGVQTATIIVSGDYAYGYTKALSGVFRLVRISPFDAAGRRHTSFMAIDVAPDLTDDTIIEVDINDCDIATFRSGGKGGQYQNKTDSGVRLTHRPTGFIAECREERSQLQNKNRCLEKLRAMIFKQREEERLNELNCIKGEKVENGWGNAICSIVLMPYQLVKDNRTNWESSNTNAFLNGEFDDFVNSYLEWIHHD